MTRTLFEITEDLRALDALLDESDGEITPENEAAYDAFFAELQQEQGAKLDAYIGLLKTWEGEEAVARSVIDQFKAKVQAIGNRIDRHRGRMLLHLVNTGQKSIKSAKGYTVARQDNGGKQPLDIDPVDPKTVPGRFQKVTVSIDADAVRAAIDAGETVPFARLKPRGQQLRIR